MDHELERHFDKLSAMRMLPFAMNSERCAAIAAACCSLFVAVLRCEAQNLVPNPSFELIDSCPYYPYYLGFQDSSKPKHWEKWQNTPDYFNGCIGSSDTVTGVPANYFGSQQALDGDAYIGMWTFANVGDVFREYVGTQFIQPLVVGETYYLSFWACAAEGSTFQLTFWASNNIGLLFTMDPNVWIDPFEHPLFPPRNYAHLRAEEVVADTANWTLISGQFTADSAYRYMAIGNFFDDLHTDTLNRGVMLSSGAYCYVDAICVSTTLDGCDFGNGISTIGSMGQAHTFPNPASHWAEMEMLGAPNATWQVTDLIGKLMLRGALDGDHSRIDVGGWAAGTYIVRIEGNKRSFVRLVVVH